MNGRRLLGLLCAAVVGVLVVLGLVVSAVLGAVGAAVYTVVALVLVVAGVVRGRRLLAPASPAPRPAGRTCDCCTTTHFDPVKVL